MTFVVAGMGCDDQSSGTAQPVTILAAASTTDAVEEIAAAFHEETGIDVRVSPGPSNGLARQVLSGAPADVFLSANEEWANAVDADGKADVIRPLLSNRLALIVPRGNPANIATVQDLLEPRVRRAALAGENVPAGRYAGQALASLGLLKRLKEAGKIARGHDVRVTLAFVERGEAEAGIVYHTDALISDRIEVVALLDADHHEPVVYPAVLVRDRPAGEAGRAFFEFLSSPAARAVFRRSGFLPVEPSP